MTVELLEVDASLVPSLWDSAGPYLDRAMEHHPFMDGEDLLSVILSGNASLVIIVQGDELRGAAALEITKFPKMLVGVVIGMGGDDIYPHMHTVMQWIEEWFRKRGCRKITELGRPGWVKVADRLGYSHARCLQVWKDL